MLRRASWQRHVGHFIVISIAGCFALSFFAGRGGKQKEEKDLRRGDKLDKTEQTAPQNNLHC
jgi:hypothetical protein